VFRVPAVLFGAVLVIRVGKTRDVYALAEEPFPGPVRCRVFLLEKLNRPRPVFGPYCVVVPLSRGEVGECSCQGFGRWRACKHNDCLIDYVREEKGGPL
jgi:hypothetical protein